MYAIYSDGEKGEHVFRALFPSKYTAEAYARQFGVECLITCPPDTATVRSLRDGTAPFGQLWKLIEPEDSHHG